MYTHTIYLYTIYTHTIYLYITIYTHTISTHIPYIRTPTYHYKVLAITTFATRETGVLSQNLHDNLRIK